MEEPTPTIQPVKKTEANDFWRFTAELLKTVFIVVVLAYTVRTFVLQPFIVEGLSMYPQFHDRDYLLVDKITYKIKDVERGDIVVFRFPKDEAFNYVKRVIALPGERVQIKNSTITVFNTQHPEGFVLSEPYVSTGNTTLPSGNTTEATYEVPADSYFVVGDNRMGSSDSREWGELPKKDLIGRVLVLAYPFDRFGLAPHAEYSNQ
jgi:signal peptidase I